MDEAKTKFRLPPIEISDLERIRHMSMALGCEQLSRLVNSLLQTHDEAEEIKALTAINHVSKDQQVFHMGVLQFTTGHHGVQDGVLVSPLYHRMMIEALTDPSLDSIAEPIFHADRKRLLPVIEAATLIPDPDDGDDTKPTMKGPEIVQ